MPQIAQITTDYCSGTIKSDGHMGKSLLCEHLRFSKCLKSAAERWCKQKNLKFCSGLTPDFVKVIKKRKITIFDALTKT